MDTLAPVVAPTVVPAVPAKVGLGTYSVAALKLAVNVAAMPQGIALLTSWVGAANPLLGLVVQFGVRGLAAILPMLTGDTVTDDQLAQHLATIGVKVVPYDPMAGFNAALGPG
jgi:hypothetical protein